MALPRKSSRPAAIALSASALVLLETTLVSHDVPDSARVSSRH